MTRREESPAIKKSITSLMASRFNMEKAAFQEVLMNTVMPKGKQVPSRSEVAAFLTVAFEYDLNPFTKQIYAFPASGGGIVPMVSIDGWIAIAERNPQMDGFTFDYIEDAGRLKGITCKLWRKDRKHPIEATEWLDECSRGTDPWKKMPRRMLRNKALGQAIRMAFGVSGIYDEDEARDIADRGERAAEYVIDGVPAADDSALDEFAPQPITMEHVTESTEPADDESSKPLETAEVYAGAELDGQPNPFAGWNKSNKKGR